MMFENREQVESYLNYDEIECLICGKRYRFLPPHLRRAHDISVAEYRSEHNLPSGTPLAGISYRQAHSDKIKRLISDGSLTYDHLDAAVEAAKKSGRGKKSSFDRERQAEIAKNIPRTQLPPGAKRADGRDADHAREYQREYRKRKRGPV